MKLVPQPPALKPYVEILRWSSIEPLEQPRPKTTSVALEPRKCQTITNKRRPKVPSRLAALPWFGEQQGGELHGVIS
jgi:hypothetical protein